ncbi:AI-2E family transporter [Aridibaculum aurantiacum]|uniref:AI-2E family transporter n=1 Tax=Aridibaculum aurantiacum TaxID=2810307 RepID=UPI001A9626CA|nr:AI-2E family transporter [Aridibaculum aurantiacum]
MLDTKEFTKRVWIAVAITALFTVVLLLLKATFSVLLLVLAGVLIAIFFRGLANMICRKTNWKSGLCLTISIIGTFLLLAGLFWLIGAKVAAQAQQLTEEFPKIIDNARQQLSQHPLGQKLITEVSSPESAGKAKKLAASFFNSSFGLLGDVYIVLLLGIFFTVAPSSYTKGMILLVPPAGRKRAEEVVATLGDNLKKWLKGKIFAMFVVFVLTAIGLAIIGVPLWLVLALIAGLLNFIPNFGPLLAIIPAALVALLEGPVVAAIVVGLYILIQTVESSVITPSIQKKLVEMPPALIIIAQLLVAPLTGVWGLILATPIILIIMTLVKQLYIEKKDATGKTNKS